MGASNQNVLLISVFTQSAVSTARRFVSVVPTHLEFTLLAVVIAGAFAKVGWEPVKLL